MFHSRVSNTPGLTHHWRTSSETIASKTRSAGAETSTLARISPCWVSATARALLIGLLIMDIQTPARAKTERSGDEPSFQDAVDAHRRELHLHCYRMLGSMQDAEDALQDSLLAAWRGVGAFEGRASFRAWLYQIATNRCLNALRERRRRPKLVLPDPPFDPPRPGRWNDPVWLDPYPDALLADLGETEPGPEARYEQREALELAFVTAL